jgi:hypothetical protein
MTGQERNDRLLSKRSQDHLLRLHRELVLSGRALEQSLTRMLATLQACDIGTQRQALAEYCAGLAAHERVIARVAGFLEHRFGIRSIGAAPGDGGDSVDLPGGRPD